MTRTNPKTKSNSNCPRCVVRWINKYPKSMFVAITKFSSVHTIFAVNSTVRQRYVGMFSSNFFFSFSSFLFVLYVTSSHRASFQIRSTKYLVGVQIYRKRNWKTIRISTHTHTLHCVLFLLLLLIFSLFIGRERLAACTRWKSTHKKKKNKKPTRNRRGAHDIHLQSHFNTFDDGGEVGGLTRAYTTPPVVDGINGVLHA